MVIKKEGSKFVVRSKSGKKLGTHKSKASASKSAAAGFGRAAYIGAGSTILQGAADVAYLKTKGT